MKLYRDFTSQAEIDLEYSLGIPALELAKYLAWFADESAKARQEQSPLFNIPQIAPPLLVTHGTLEPREYCRQSTDYLTAWQAAGLPGWLMPQAGKDHLSMCMDFIDPNSTLCNTVVEFTQECLKNELGGAGQTT
jgi:hypothetical protein